jgi:hypothetical protein
MRTRPPALGFGLLALTLVRSLSAQVARCGEFRGEGGSYLSRSIREAIPGVGGYFWDDNCNFVVLLTDLAYADSARSCYASLIPTTERFRGRVCDTEPTVRVLPAEFTVQEVTRARYKLYAVLNAAHAGARVSVDDSTQTFSVLVKNERARSDAEAAIRDESSLAPYKISVGLKPPAEREYDGPGNPPAAAYSAAIWHLKTVFEVRYNEQSASPDRWMRLQCVTFSEIPGDFDQITLAPLGLWFGDCGRQQTIRFGPARAFQSGAYGIRTLFAGYCGDVRVEPDSIGWAARFTPGQCGVEGTRVSDFDGGDSSAPRNYTAWLDLVGNDSVEVFSDRSFHWDAVWTPAGFALVHPNPARARFFDAGGTRITSVDLPIHPHGLLKLSSTNRGFVMWEGGEAIEIAWSGEVAGRRSAPGYRAYSFAVVDEAVFVPTVDSLYYLVRATPDESRLWGRRTEPPMNVDSVAWITRMPLHNVAVVEGRVYVLDVAQGAIVVFDLDGRRVNTRKLPADLAERLRKKVYYKPRAGGYNLSVPVSSFRFDGMNLVIRGDPLVIIDPVTLDLTVVGADWLPPSWPRTVVRSDTLITITDWGRLHYYQLRRLP